MQNNKQKIIENFINKKFVKNWEILSKDHPSTPSKDQIMLAESYGLELMYNCECNLSCAYCYYNRFEDALYPAEHHDVKLILNNIDTLIEYLEKNKLYPSLSIFSGEMTVQPVAIEIIDKILDYMIRNQALRRVPFTFGIPTNMSFLDKDCQTSEMDRLIKKASDHHILFGISASVDGKYCDTNRPYKNGRIRDDSWYEKMFNWGARNNLGFHPMVYAEKIENWKDNFLWYIENMIRHNIHPSELYLLEVRNADWSSEQMNEFYKFIRFLVNWQFNHNELFHDKNFASRLLGVNSRENFNILGNAFSKISRGIGCTLQTSLFVRPLDFSFYPCHRTQYSVLKAGHINFCDDHITIKPANVENYIVANTFSIKTLPWCEKCLIKEFCVGGCPGAQFETSKEMYLPNFNVCKLEHLKLKAIVDECIKLNQLTNLLEYIPQKDKYIILEIGKAYDDH